MILEGSLFHLAAFACSSHSSFEMLARVLWVGVRGESTPQPGGSSAQLRMMDGGAMACHAASVDNCVINLMSSDAAAGETFKAYRAVHAPRSTSAQWHNSDEFPTVPLRLLKCSACLPTSHQGCGPGSAQPFRAAAPGPVPSGTFLNFYF